MVLAARTRSALKLLDLLADRARFFLAVPATGHLHFLAEFIFGSQGLAEATFVVGDEVGRSRQNMSGTAVVPL